MRKLYVSICLSLCVLINTADAQRIGSAYHHESVNMPYRPNAYNNQRTSPAYRQQSVLRTTGTTIFTAQVNVDSAGNNIINDAANEPSIAINPLNPNQIAIGWRQFDDISSDFRQAGYAYSIDAGQTWTFPDRIEAGVFRSDPVLDFDTDGNFFYNSLTVPGYLCDVFKSTNGGASWGLPVDGKGGDKQWMAIDRTNGQGRGNIYSAWSSYASSCDPDIFTRSTDGGLSYENCSFIDGDPRFGTMAIGTNGELYVAGFDYNLGTTVISFSTNAQIPGSVVNWQAVLVNMDGYITSGPVNPAGLLGQVNVETDLSGTSTNGNVYMLASMEMFNGDPSDVVFVRSTDGGNTWSAPVKLNDDVSFTNNQWLGALSVAPNGRLDAVWLDTRDAPGSDSSALYYSYSTDGGLTWSVNEQMSPLFDPHVGYPVQQKMGDYFDMISDENGAHVAWAGTLNGEQDVYYSYIQPGSSVGISSADLIHVSIYPNPAKDLLTIKVSEPVKSIRLLSMMGSEIRNIEANTSFNVSDLSGGLYIVEVISVHGERVLKKVVVD